MKKIMYKDDGLLSIEACVSLTIFMLFMLFFYGLFVVFEVRNAMGHAVLSTANSLAMDKVQNTELGDADTIVKPIFHMVYGDLEDSSNGFATTDRWYETGADLEDELKTRFCAYLAGGDESRAEKILEKYHIQGGKDGLDFSKSKVENNKLYIVLDYTVEYEYKVFNQIGLKFEQAACSRIWE
ncbi:MAG: hypothetical protein K6F51_09595 [Acetatifactor sp.]|nr:hypothetical protein [Acetatifactor sp.]